MGVIPGRSFHFLNAIVRHLAFIALLAAATLATGQSDGQSQPVVHQATPADGEFYTKLFEAEQKDIANHVLHVKDIEAQQPQERLAASEPCQQAFNDPKHHITQRTLVQSGTVARSLSDLMEKSDEVVLAGASLRHTFVLSPSGDSAVDYFDVRVFRSWKGTHEVGDTLTFAVPVGTVRCGITESGTLVSFSTMIGYYSTALRNAIWKGGAYNGPYILFLRHPQGKETELVQTLFPTGAEGLQGMFPILLNPASEEGRRCYAAQLGDMEWCDSFLETSPKPIEVPYFPDPLAKKYDGMRIADFLQEVRNLAADQGLNEKRP